MTAKERLMDAIKEAIPGAMLSSEEAGFEGLIEAVEEEAKDQLLADFGKKYRDYVKSRLR